MGFRFQRRLKLFPGVRLNFSRSGISTTIGVRGASVTLGAKGSHVNLGIPGTGLSYRGPLTHAASDPASASNRHPNPPTVPDESQSTPRQTTNQAASEIHSGPIP